MSKQLQRCGVHISTMSGKLEGILAINTNTLSNAFCRESKESICQMCYSKRMLATFRTSCVESFEYNSRLLSKPLKERDIPRFRATVFVRFNGHGELINKVHYENLVKICNASPGTWFALWTKRVSLVEGVEKPSNLQLIYSNPVLDAPLVEPPTGFDAVFNIVTKPWESAENVYWKCQKKCISCLHCYVMKTGKQPILEMLK